MSIVRRSLLAVLVLGAATAPTATAHAQGGQVLPDGASVTKPPSTSVNTVAFQVTKYGGTRELVRFLCRRSGDVTSCTPPKAVRIDPDQTVQATLKFATGAQGVGTATLVAWAAEFGEDSGWVNVAVLAAPVSTRDTLIYDANGKLDRIIDPTGRVLDARVSSGLLTSLKDPSGDSVLYGYDGEKRLTTRTNRRGHQTTYRYVNGLRVTAVEIPLTSPTDWGIDSLAYWDERGLVIGQPGETYTAQDPATVYTHLDGPRTDVADATRFWVDRWGAPTRIERDALGVGYNTYLTRGDPNVPALVTEVQAPNGFTTRATYDPRGNVLTTTEVGPYAPSDPRDAVTRYEWDPTWDFVTKIKQPEQDSLVFGYSSSNGNRLWQQDGRGISSRVNFNYGNAHNLLSSVVLPGGARDSVVYSGELANPFLFRTSLGFVTTRRQDLLGRDTLVLTPIDAGHQQRQRVVYDAMNRVLRQQNVGPAMPGVAAAESVLVQNFYDKEGDLDSLLRESTPDPAAIGRLKTWWRYDFGRRQVKEIAPDGKWDSTLYDPAGNPITVYTRLGHSLTMAYDVLNRLRQRTFPAVQYDSIHESLSILDLPFLGPKPYPWYGLAASKVTIPGDVETYAYDVGGNVVRADNGDAHVRRSYHANGRLDTDTLKILSYGTRDSTTNVYGMRYTYDLNGRVTNLAHPPRLTAGAVSPSVYYAYDDAGFLESGTLVGASGQAYFLAYNDRGELVRVDLPGGIRDSSLFDGDGRRTVDRVMNNSSSIFAAPASILGHTDLAYDDAARVTRGANPTYGVRDSTRAWYSGLGHLVKQMYVAQGNTQWGDPAQVEATEEFLLDGLSNIYSMWDSTNYSTETGSSTHSQWRARDYSPLPGQQPAGRLRLATQTGRTDYYKYDAAGNLTFKGMTWDAPDKALRLEDQAFFYGTDGRLRIAEYRAVTKPASQYEPWTWVQRFEEYRYDALGRRVMVRTRRHCYEEAQDPNVHCALGTLRRTVWAGAAELWEIQVPGHDGVSPAIMDDDTTAVDLAPATWPTYFDRNPYFGRVAYSYAGGLDRPIGVTRINYVDRPYSQSRMVWPAYEVMPHWSWRGQADYGTFWGPYASGTNDGGVVHCWTAARERCVQLEWRHAAFAYQQGAPNVAEDGWHGTLLVNKQDAVGTLYRRNRVVDPVTGRFTQEDPIGLAGGLNLYGFANGDPINFSDPFGLCPPELTGRPCLSPLAGAALRTRVTAFNPDVGRFGIVRDGGTKAHQGWDILADVGSSVTAADDGVVTFAGIDGTHGLRLQIGHKNAAGEIVSYTSYSHLGSLADGLTEGSVVRGGQVIGEAGVSGNAAGTEPHLHLELRTAKRPGPELRDRRDPAQYYRQACGERCW